MAIRAYGARKKNQSAEIRPIKETFQSDLPARRIERAAGAARESHLLLGSRRHADDRAGSPSRTIEVVCEGCWRIFKGPVAASPAPLGRAAAARTRRRLQAA